MEEKVYEITTHDTDKRIGACLHRVATLFFGAAKALALRNQSVAGQLNRMEREGFVRRIPKRRGKPYTDVVATPQGKALRDKAEPFLWAMASRVTKGMEAKDKQAVVAALGHLRDNLLDELRMDVVAPPWSS